MKIYTIGFTKKSARTFFERLRSQSGLSTLVDVRLNNVSQLAGFAKRDDLEYFLQQLCGISYLHDKSLAPLQPMLDDYKKKRGAWESYEQAFLQLMRERSIETLLDRSQLENACLLCSEDKPHHCHRRLVAEYLQQHWENVDIVHL